MKTKVWILDGLVAAGKTSVLQQIKEPPLWVKVYEPVYKYRNFIGSGKTFNALELYYSNPKQNGVCTQLHIIDSLETLMKDISINPMVISERHLTSVKAFTQTMLDNGTTSEFSGAFICQKLDEALTRVNEYSHIEKIIFLDTDIDICIKRWQTRERREEMCFSEEEMTSYLTLLRENYLEFYG